MKKNKPNLVPEKKMHAQIVTYNAMMEEWLEGQVSSITALNWTFTGCTVCKTSFIPTEPRVAVSLTKVRTEVWMMYSTFWSQSRSSQPIAICLTGKSNKSPNCFNLWIKVKLSGLSDTNDSRWNRCLNVMWLTDLLNKQSPDSLKHPFHVVAF